MTAATDKRHHEKRKASGQVRVNVWVHEDDREKVIEYVQELRKDRDQWNSTRTS